jgi:HEAT repeat protein
MVRVIACLGLWLLCAAFEWPGYVEQLAYAANHGEPEQRREALQQLASYPSDAARQAVLRGLDDADPTVRLEAARSAGKLRMKAAVPALIDWLSEPDADLRDAAAHALGALGDPAAAAPLARLLGDGSAKLRLSAVEALAKLAGAEAVTPLLGRLDDPDVSVRLAAVEGLGAIGDVQAVVGLLGRVDDPAIEVRMAVLLALGALGDARAVDSLSGALGDPLEDVRLAAAAGLGQLGAASSVPALEQALAQADGRLSSALLAALGAVDSDPARALLLRSLGAGERSLQATAALAENARRFDAPGAPTHVLPALLAELAAAREPTRLAALCETLLALARFQSIAPATEPLLARLAGDPNPEPRLIEALAQTRDPRVLLPMLERLGQAQEPLRGVLLDGLTLYFEHAEPQGLAADPLLQVLPLVEPERRPQVVRLLGRIGEPRALPTLRPLLDSPSRELALAAVAAIGAIGDPEAAPALLERLAARDPELRQLAASALAKAADGALISALLDRLAKHDGMDPHAVLLAIGRSLSALDARHALDPKLAERAGRALRSVALGRDEALAARALHAIAGWHPVGSGQLLGEVLRYPSSRRRYQAALALAELPGSESQVVLRFLLRSGHRRQLPAAILALGEVGDGNDVPKLLHLALRHPWPVPAATSYALARMARRGAVRGAAIQDQLCKLGASREPYVRANVAAGLAALGARPCPDDGPDPLKWLGSEHAPAVRVAAARWAHAALARERIDATRARSALTRCASGDQEPSVARACREPEPPPNQPAAQFVAHGRDGQGLLRDTLVAVRLADGLVFLAHTDANGELHLPASVRGDVLLEDPATQPLEPQ